MKTKNIIIIISYQILLLVSLSGSFADPVNPPPPPSTTSYTYILMDEFKSCGSSDNEANYCDKYYLRQKVVSSESETTITDVNVCGKDSRCEDGVACEITSPKDNLSWKSIPLEEEWFCPDGYGIAQMHQPGILDPNYDTLDIAADSIIDQSNHGYSLPHGVDSDLYFNSYIPACVNRIPMMNFNVYLDNGGGNKLSEKTGIYALHETLDYDASPLGGKLKNFSFPKQENFRNSYDLTGDLRTYRMWSFRERFTEGLVNVVNSNDLELPENINVDTLDSTSEHDFEKIYFSRDYMLGSFSVDNVGGEPVGTDIIQELELKCNLDVNDLDVRGIDSNEDLKDKYTIGSFENRVINSIISNDLCKNLESDMDLREIMSVETLESIDPEESRTNVVINDIDSIGISKSRFSNIEEFDDWADENKVLLSSRLRDKGILNSEEEIKDIDRIQRYTANLKILLEPSDLGFSNRSDLVDYLNSLSRSEYAQFSKSLEQEGYIEDRYLLFRIGSISTESSDVRLEANFYTSKANIKGSIVDNKKYDGFAELKLKVNYLTTTSNSWSWRSLEDLTLTSLAKCLYNWDKCLFNARDEPTVSWEMNEIADLGFGPAMDSIAYQWTQGELLSEFDLEYGFHFDGARGFNTQNIPITTFKSCNEGDEWISGEGYYLCYNSTTYKCEFGISADEVDLNVIQATIGNTINSPAGGYVCNNVNIGGVLEPRWSVVSCPVP